MSPRASAVIKSQPWSNQDICPWGPGGNARLSARGPRRPPHGDPTNPPTARRFVGSVSSRESCEGREGPACSGAQRLGPGRPWDLRVRAEEEAVCCRRRASGPRRLARGVRPGQQSPGCAGPQVFGPRRGLPTRTVLDALTDCPSSFTCPPAQALPAIDRVLKQRAAQSHLSMRTSLSSVMSASRRRVSRPCRRRSRAPQEVYTTPARRPGSSRCW